MKTLRLLQKLCILILFPFTWQARGAENIRFSHIGLEDGLSHSSVFAIGQDKEGYLWFATSDGVNKYDGYNFTVYRHRYADAESIASDVSRCIAIDAADRIWIGTWEGLSRYERNTDSFSNYYYKKKNKNVAVNNILPIDSTRLMLGTAEGILLFDAMTEHFLSDTLPAAVHALKNAALTRQGDAVYIGAENGLYCYSLTKRNIRKLVGFPGQAGIQALLCQQFNRIWIATEGDGLYVYDIQSGQLKNYRYADGASGLSSNHVRSLAVDLDNRIWVGTYNGLGIYKESEDRFVTLKSSAVQDGCLSQNSVRSIFKDSQGGMWLGTYWGGLNYYHPLCNRFQHIKHIPFLNSLSDNVVSCIVEDKEANLWIGTNDGGLDFYDNSRKEYINYLFDSNGQDAPFKDIKAVYIDEKSGQVYVGAHAGGMMVLDRKTGRREYFNRRNSNLPSNNIYSILSDGEGGLWVASLEYLLRFDPQKRLFTIVDKDCEGQPLRQDNRLLFRDSKKRLWTAGDRGLSVYTQQGTGLRTDTDYVLPPVLSQLFINCIYESSAGVIWIGTRNGLFALTEKSDRFVRYTVDDGLPSNVIYGVLEDAYRRLWISTNSGLSCLGPESGKMRNFTVIDGLQSNQFNAGSYCRTGSGQMLFGGIDGITSFCPETLVDNPYTPKPVINKLFVFNKEVLPGDETGILEKSIEKQERITLASSQNSFSLSFVVSNYIAGRHNTFAYRLLGYDKQEYRQEDTRPVSYANLPAGEYTFSIKAANNDGLWNEVPALLHIRVLPVWYRTWWALAFFAATFVVLVTLVFRFFWIRKSMQAEIRMERLAKEKQEEINQMKIRFYIDISHELRTPLTLITAPLQELLNRIPGHWEHEQLRYIQRNANRLLHLVNQLMDYRRAELGIFRLQAVRANAYRRVLHCFLNYEKLARKKDIDYNLHTELQDKKVLFDANYLDLIVNNLLSNAFKYTAEGESVTVRLYEEENRLAVEVADTGAGIPEEKQKRIFERFYQAENKHAGSGIGLSLVQRLVELHHGTITVSSEVGKGSVFTVFFPQDESVYTPEELPCEPGAEEDEPAGPAHTHALYTGDEGTSLPDEQPGEARGKYGTILLVEDNAELRQYISAGLSEQFELLEAETGEQALELLKEKEADLVITDVMMPGMGGIKLCKRLKQNLRTCHIPVYMLSAKTDIKYQLEGLQVGADDYIPKPFSLTVLKSKIKNMLRTRARMFEHYSDTIEIEPEKIAGNSLDEELLRKAVAVVEKHIDDTDFSTGRFASEMNMSRSNLHLKLKAITGKSAIDFIHRIRFNRACQLLKEGKYSVSEISFMVGYSTPSYFAACFKKYVGCLPTEYGKKA